MQNCLDFMSTLLDTCTHLEKPRDGPRNSNVRKCIALLLLRLGSSAFSVVLFLLCNFHFLTKV